MQLAFGRRNGVPGAIIRFPILLPVAIRGVSARWAGVVAYRLRGEQAGSEARPCLGRIFHLYGARPKSFADTSISFIYMDFRGLSDSPECATSQR